MTRLSVMITVFAVPPVTFVVFAHDQTAAGTSVSLPLGQRLCSTITSHGLLLMIFETCLTSEFLLQGTRSPLNAHDGLELQSLHV